MTLKEMRQTRRAELLNVKRRTFKCAGKRNDHMLHYEQVFGNVSERRESKCCAVLMKHCRKVKGEQVITLQMAQQLHLFFYKQSIFEPRPENCSRFSKKSPPKIV